MNGVFGILTVWGIGIGMGVVFRETPLFASNPYSYLTNESVHFQKDTASFDNV